jgi:type IV secretion system protein VirD4
MEWTAWRLGFQSQLGRPWLELLGWPIYQPPAFFWWWFADDAYAQDVFVEGAYIAAPGGIAGAYSSGNRSWCKQNRLRGPISTI